jgi:hypothetical protein
LLSWGFGCSFFFLFLNGFFFMSSISLKYPLFSLFWPLHLDDILRHVKSAHLLASFIFQVSQIVLSL